MSLVKQLTTVSEFEKWQSYFRLKQTLHDKSDWYAAQTTWAIFASQGAKKLKPSDYLLEFKLPETEKKKERTWEQERDLWLGMLGVKQESDDVN